MTYVIFFFSSNDMMNLSANLFLHCLAVLYFEWCHNINLQDSKSRDLDFFWYSEKFRSIVSGFLGIDWPNSSPKIFPPCGNIRMKNS